MPVPPSTYFLEFSSFPGSFLAQMQRNALRKLNAVRNERPIVHPFALKRDAMPAGKAVHLHPDYKLIFVISLRHRVRTKL